MGLETKEMKNYSFLGANLVNKKNENISENETRAVLLILLRARSPKENERSPRNNTGFFADRSARIKKKIRGITRDHQSNLNQQKNSCNRKDVVFEARRSG